MKFLVNQYARCECELRGEWENSAEDFPICTHYEPEDNDFGMDICRACRHGESCHLRGHESKVCDCEKMYDPYGTGDKWFFMYDCQHPDDCDERIRE